MLKRLLAATAIATLNFAATASKLSVAMAENITMWIGVGTHCNCTYSRLDLRCRFVAFERLCG